MQQKASLFRYLWEQVMFKTFLKFQEPFLWFEKSFFRLSASTPLILAITYAFCFVETENFLSVMIVKRLSEGSWF